MTDHTEELWEIARSVSQLQSDVLRLQMYTEQLHQSIRALEAALDFMDATVRTLMK